MISIPGLYELKTDHPYGSNLPQNHSLCRPLVMRSAGEGKLKNQVISVNETTNTVQQRLMDVYVEDDKER